jgi:hypothetical protein
MSFDSTNTDSTKLYPKSNTNTDQIIKDDVLIKAQTAGIRCPNGYNEAGSYGIFVELDSATQKIRALQKAESKPNSSTICIGPSNASFKYSDSDKNSDKKYVDANKQINCPFGKPFKTPGGNYLCVVNMTDI